MHAVYGRGCLPSIARNLEAGRLRLISIFPDVRVREITDAELLPFGEPGAGLFFNCNTPRGTWKRARRWTGRRKG